MDFRDLGNGKYFPPILPNGLVRGYAPGVIGNAVDLMKLVDTGIQLNGLLIEWDGIDGVSILNDRMTIHSNVFLCRDFVFYFDGMSFCSAGQKHFESYQQGYPIHHALMNRITFEVQIEEALDSPRSGDVVKLFPVR